MQIAMRDANGNLSEIRAMMDEIDREVGKPEGRWPKCTHGCGWCVYCGECVNHGSCVCQRGGVPRTRTSDPNK